MKLSGMGIGGPGDAHTARARSTDWSSRMTDHIAAVRAQAKRESELASSQRIKDSIQEWRNAIGANDDAWPDDWELEFWHAGYKHGAYSVIEWLASRLTRDKIADAITNRPTGQSAADAILALLVDDTQR